MLWRKGRSSSNVEQSTGGGGGGFGRIHLGVGGTIIAIIIAMIFPSTRGLIFGLLTGTDSGMAPTGATSQTSQVDCNRDAQTDFVCRILGSTEDVWTAYFQRAGG